MRRSWEGGDGVREMRGHDDVDEEVLRWQILKMDTMSTLRDMKAVDKLAVDVQTLLLEEAGERGGQRMLASFPARLTTAALLEAVTCSVAVATSHVSCRCPLGHPHHDRCH